MISDKLQSNTSIWPQFPYKGLSYYEPQDIPIFTGREQDLLSFANVLSNYTKRVVILHGRTGCGKSSFLRANVIPFLERHEHGFQFFKTDDAKHQKALFVRSTDAPLVVLSDTVYDFLSKDFLIKTPIGERSLDLSKASLGYTTAKDFRDNTCENPEQMLEALNIISANLPTTLVIIIDQAEEALTVKPGKDGDAARSHFFQFLSLFSRIKIDMKILIAIRTEHYGIFHNAMRQYELKISSIDDHLLEELDEDNLIRAIARPTSLEDYEGYGCPRDQYKFSYEKNLPEVIAQDLKKATPMGGLLPVMQIVCSKLYNSTKDDEKEWIISKEDYNELGRVEGQVTAHLDEALTRLCRKSGINLSEIQLEVSRWKNVLLMLAKNQVDGTVTTDFKTEADLYEAALKEKSVLDFKKVMNFLSDDQQRIIRKSEVVNVQTGLNVTCYSLGHDAIGLALKNYIPQINLIKPKGRVFICYAKEDVKYAKKIYNDLKNEGIEAWLDEINLVPGQNWELEIKKAIKDSSYFLALFSSNSVSKRGYIHKELKIAFDLLAEFPASETFIIPARLDNCKPSDKELRNIHWADLFPSYEEGLKDILRIFGFKKSDKKKIIEDTIAKITDFDRSAYLPRKVLHIKDDIPENILLRSKLSQDIVNLVSKQNRIALTGDAGTGKTTTLKMIAWHFSKEDALFYPLLISLNKCSENLPLVKLLPLTWTGIPEKQLLIILDGLDEVDSRNRKNVIDEIEWLADSYPLSHIIVSCRTNFYQSGTLKGFSSYVFDELAYEEIQKYIEKKLHKWTDEFYKAIDQNQLGELLEIPFYLIYLVEIYQNDALPTNKAEIFERLLFERRQYDAEHFKTTLALDEKRNQIIDTLERLALCMETLCRNYITDDEFQQIIPDEDSREIIKYCTLWNAAKLQFEHNNFQEYLAARILSRQSFEIIKEFISFKPDYKKIIPSWVNTISFILSISDDQKLFNWILDNEPEIAVKFEPDKIEASDKIRIFKNIFNNYKRKQIWIDSEKFNFRELGRFGQSDEIIEFLLAEAENPAHYTTLNESIKLLWVMKLPEKFKQRAVNLLVSSALNNDIPEHVQNTPLLALADLKLNSREIVEKITSELRYSDNPWTRYGLYYFLHNSDYLDENIDVFLEGLKYLRFNRFDPLSNIKRPRLTNETWELKIGLTKDKSCESIKKILIHFEEHGMDLLNISLKDEDISIIADNASKAYYKDNSVFEYALNFFPVCRRSGQERANSFILFFDKTNTRLRAFQEILCKEDDGKWRLLAVLADEKCMNFFAEQYKENKITDSDVWNFQNNLALETNELYLPFNKLINEVSDNKFILPQRQNFEKEKKDRSRQHDINLLFDKQAFLDEIKHIFDSEQKQNLTSDELIHFYWPEKDYSDLAVEKLDSIADDQSVSYEQAVETINRWDWNWFCISNIYNYLINDEATKLSQKQEKWIADWCYSRIDKVDFKTENYVWDAIYLWYFLKRLDLNYPKNVLLDMLSFDYMHNDIECLEERLNKSDMTSRILENLEQGITVDNVLKNHIDYCKRHRIKQGIKFAIREIANTEKEKYDEVRRVALETVCELSYTLSELEEILPQITDDFKWNVINELVKNESEYVHNFLSEIFSAEKNEEKFKYAEYLIRFQNIDALKYYVDEIKREKKFSRSQYNTSPLHYLQTLEALPLLIDLLELTYHEDFNQEDNFERLDRLILDTLNRIALQSDHHYAEVKEAVNNFTDQYLSVYNKVNWLHSFLDRLEQKYYTNKSEQLTLEDIIRKLQKIK